MLAALGLEDPVGVLAADREGGALQARLLPRARLEQLDLEAALGGPALVHPQHHLGPVLRVGAAGAGLERDDGVAGVVLAVEERRLLEPLELAPERLDRRLDLVRHLAGVELAELARVLVLARQPLVHLEPLARRARARCEIFCARWPGRPRSPGSLSSASSSPRRCSSVAGSKVITDPGELDPDLVELLWRVAPVSAMSGIVASDSMWNARALADGGPDAAHLARIGLERRPRYALRPTRATCLVWHCPRQHAVPHQASSRLSAATRCRCPSAGPP